ncbi:MAG: sugar phosphate isomerase/epimerase [Sphaerochaeta sp.]
MRIATSTNLISFNRDGSKTEMIHLLPLYAKEGMRILDLNLCEMLNPTSSLRNDEYMKYVLRLSELRDMHGLTFNQAHAPYVGDRNALSESEGAFFDFLLTRSMEICNLLSIPLLVVHPIKDSVAGNIAYYRPFVDFAEKLDLVLAFENLNAVDEMTEAEDLCLLIDAFDSKSAGICYDFGHGHMNGHDVRKDILAFGPRLVATHVADNHGKEDEHLLPYYGTIDWRRALQALKKVQYAGDLTYECMFFNQHLPLEMKVHAIRQARVMGEYLLSIVP